jgi:hypothetical protein
MHARRKTPLKKLTIIQSMDPMRRKITSTKVIYTEIWFFSGKNVIAIEDTERRDVIYYDKNENPSIMLTL